MSAHTPQLAQAPSPLRELVLLPLRRTIIYPLTVTPLSISLAESVHLADAAIEAGAPVGLVALREDQDCPSITAAALFPVGTASLLHRMVRLHDGTLRVAAEGIERFTIVTLTQAEPYLRAQILPLPESPPDAADQAAARAVMALAAHVARVIPPAAEAAAAVAAETDPARVAYLAAARLLLRSSLTERQAILELPTTAERLAQVLALLRRDLAAIGAATLP